MRRTADTGGWRIKAAALQIQEEARAVAAKAQADLAAFRRETAATLQSATAEHTAAAAALGCEVVTAAPRSWPADALLSRRRRHCGGRCLCAPLG